MTYQVLARKWRPQHFSSLIGQDHVLQALVNALDSQRLHHAYLFTGTRGVGKTTIARLIAKALNCEQGVSSQPCGQCASCVDIAAGRFVDLYEVDAASRTKVEDTRELLDNVQYAPTRGRFKVYLIDEVHMLSSHSFNALLKTLEEPPAHVKFLLATTDPQKLPVTVLSRCLQFHLKNLLPTQISQHLADILQQEAIAYEATALALLAQAANGSMRDGLSLLDQAIVTGGGAVDQASVEMMLGICGQQVVVDLLQAFLAQDLTALLAVSQRLQDVGADMAYVLLQLQEIWHSVALQQLGAKDIGLSVLWSDVVHQLAQQFTPPDIQLFYEITALGRRDVSLAPSAKLGFEMVLLRLLAFQPQADTSRLQQRPMLSTPAAPAVAPTKVDIKRDAPREPVMASAPVSPAPTLEVEPPHTSAAVQNSVQSSPLATSDWLSVLPQLALTAFSKVLAEHLCFERRVGDHFYMSLAQEHAVMAQERHQRKIVEALSHHFGKPIQLTVQLGRASAAKSSLEIQAVQHQQQTQQALQDIEQDAPLQRVLHSFEAKVLPDTLAIEA